MHDVANGDRYQPVADDFQAVKVKPDALELTRPSLSYWQDAWRRLKQNRRALFSFYLIILLAIFTIFGPKMWSVDPFLQDLDQISQAPTLQAKKAILIDKFVEMEPIILTDVPAESDQFAEDLLAPASIFLRAEPNTQVVRLGWQAVEGASGYAIYRNNRQPTSVNDLGLPLGETDAGNLVSYDDRLSLEGQSYFYSIVPTDGSDEAEIYTTLEVDVKLAIAYEKAVERNLLTDLNAPIGSEISLEYHPLGTDYLGRDMLARLIYGAQASLFIGIMAPFIFVFFGTVYGGIAGYYGGKVDQVMMRFADFVVSLPFLLFMILFRIGFGVGPGESGIFPLLLALVILYWPATARLVRGQVLQIREEAFIQAARLLGGKGGYLVRRHLIPNALGPILVTLTFSVPTAIFIEAFLSFIGMGVAPPTPSWGAMCNEGIKSMLSHPHELILPALLISITVLAFNLFGDGLRDALDSRLRSTE